MRILWITGVFISAFLGGAFAQAIVGSTSNALTSIVAAAQL